MLLKGEGIYDNAMEILKLQKTDEYAKGDLSTFATSSGEQRTPYGHFTMPDDYDKGNFETLDSKKTID